MFQINSHQNCIHLANIQKIIKLLKMTLWNKSGLDSTLNKLIKKRTFFQLVPTPELLQQLLVILMHRLEQLSVFYYETY
jgi:hypothetical protein